MKSGFDGSTRISRLDYFVDRACFDSCKRTMSQIVVITDLRGQRSVEWLRGGVPDNAEAENVKAPLVNQEQSRNQQQHQKRTEGETEGDRCGHGD